MTPPRPRSPTTHTKGATFLSEGLWRLVVPPVMVYFEIDAAGRRVTITDVLPAP